MKQKSLSAVHFDSCSALPRDISHRKTGRLQGLGASIEGTIHQGVIHARDDNDECRKAEGKRASRTERHDKL